METGLLLPLLFVASFLGNAYASTNDGRLSYKGQACDGQTLTMDCPQGYAMTFTYAFYGRNDLEYCLSSDLNDILLDNCSHPDPLLFLKAACENSYDCKFFVNASQFEDDPCQGTSKFLVTEYFCSEVVDTDTACEGDHLLLECPNDQALYIKDLFYGRKDNKTCIHDSALLTANCSSTTALNVIRELCISKQSCDIYIYSSLLGEPCSGTYKYLEVEYSCFECVNLYGDDTTCDQWASWGECEVNNDWMTAHCRKSCLRCDFQQACDNIDSDEDCLYWAAIGECSINPYYMQEYCKKACNKCPLEASAYITDIYSNTTTTPTTPFVPVWTEDECYNVDTDADCNYWQQIDECRLNPVWMSENCAKSCGICQGNNTELCTNIDSDKDCDYWTSVGECRYNPHYMLVNCRHSCGLCNVTDNCTNIESEMVCQYYRNVGECEDNFPYMAEYCKRSCGFCGENDTYTTLAPHVACLNTYGNDKKCDEWANQGECVYNRDWMEVRCGLSCGKCVTAPTGACINLHDNELDCEHWKSIGWCESSSWMKEYCAATCGLCQPEGGAKTTPEPLIDLIDDKRLCVNRNTNITFCREWAENGFCRLESAHGTRDCRKSCGLCHETADGVASQIACETQTASLVCSQSEGLRIYEAFYGRSDNTTCSHTSVLTDNCPSHWSVTDTVKSTCQGRQWCHASAHSEVFSDPCPGTYKYLEVKYACQDCVNAYDDDNACNRWAEQGECETNHYWMADNCFKSCSRCHISECLNPVEDDVSCDYWAMRRECELNPDWMMYNCQESCRECTEEIHRDRTLPPTPTSTLSTTQASATLPTPIHSEICEGASFTLSCPQDKGIIIKSAFYGRESWDICPNGLPYHQDLICSSTTILTDLRRQCNGKPTCLVEVLPGTYGDPCYGLLKYLETVHECFDLETFTCSSDCGDHGRCIDTDECMCSRGYTGQGCTDFSCEYEANCSGHGQCTGPGQCSCNEGWTGLDCNIAICSSNCSYQGNCIAPEKCWCYPYFSGDDCSDCLVAFKAGSSCIPCPNCVHGTCHQDETTTGHHSYIGCFHDIPGVHDLQMMLWVGEDTNTVTCVQACHARGFQFAGLQNGDTCYCGDSYGGYGASLDCTVQCNHGDNGEICGGRLSNSVWKVHENSCQCEKGWKGPLCDVCNDSTCEIPKFTTTEGSPDIHVSTPYPVVARVKVDVLLTTPWSDTYKLVTPVNKISIVDATLTQVSDYLTSIHLDHLGFESTKLSSASEARAILMSTQLMLQSAPLNLELYRRSLFCHLSNAFDAGLIRNATGVRAAVTQQEVDLCFAMETYCGDHGQVVGSSPDNTSCECFDGYSGHRCELDQWETTKMIIIIVVCTVVPLITIIVLCLVLRHKHFIRLPFRTSVQEEGSFKYQDMNRARRNTSRKLFQMQRTDENQDDEGYTPRQI